MINDDESRAALIELVRGTTANLEASAVVEVVNAALADAGTSDLDSQLLTHVDADALSELLNTRRRSTGAACQISRPWWRIAR